MIEDEIDRMAGEKKPAPVPTRARIRWRPSFRDVITVLVTAALAWTLSCLAYSPSAIDLRNIEAHRAVPNFYVEVEEMPGKDDGEMELTIDLSNIGPRDYPVFAAIRPLQRWVSFGPEAAVRTDPPQPFTARIRADHAMVRLRDPMKSGTHASITLSGIKVGDHGLSGQRTYQAIHLYVFTGSLTARINRHRELPANPPTLKLSKPGGQ